MEIKPGSILAGPFWTERVRVLAASPVGPGRLKVEAVGLDTRSYYDPVFTEKDLEAVTVFGEEKLEFSARGEAAFLFVEAHRMRNAFQFDPLHAVNVSQVDPLPHQIDAVYNHILKSPTIRFLLADDPGAGKTIMAGLLLKELKYRGLVNRTLIVVPGHLKEQWLREMKEKFQETFTIVDRAVMNATWGQNVWTENSQIIASLDFAKQDDVMMALKDATWDLVIVDEAHKMSAYKYGDKIDKTARYQFGELLSARTRHLLFLTATPHRGDPENFRLFLDLLQPGFFADTTMLAQSIQDRDNPLFLRRLKEDLKGFDGQPLFLPRQVDTITYRLSDDEKVLYNQVTEYVENHYNKAMQKEKRNVAFAMTILQRRLASSVRAGRRSLERRRDRLIELYRKGQVIQQGGYSEEYLEDLEERERWQKEEEMLEKLTSAETLEELKDEIDRLEELVALARETEKKEVETKLSQLRNVMEQEKIRETGTKLLVFTESRDTQEYLTKKLEGWGYRVTSINGTMDMDRRIQAEHQFWHEAQIMVATEAAGEGINLQCCWLMVNYDIPWNPNRLEQRMGRVHRYGQPHEVHIYNLVASDTREGKVLAALFAKLERMKEHLGSDRVFDVIGDILPNMNLKDLILDAISNRRTAEEIAAEIDRVPDQKLVEQVRAATMEALATRHIDLSRVLGEQRRARENRLAPEYVERFFLRAAPHFDLKVERRQDGLLRVAVPYALRNQPYSFRVKYGQVHREYSRVSFDKDRARALEAEFVSLGHPLMEALIGAVLEKYGPEAGKGAVFADPDGRRDGFLWFLSGEVRDGRGEVAGRRLFCVYQDQSGSLSPVNPAVLWDLKPLDPDELDGAPSGPEPLSRQEVAGFAVAHEMEPYREELLEQRRRDAAIKEKYGLRSVESMILESEAKLADYETRKMKGENLPDVTILQERRRREELEAKRERLAADIRASTSLYVSDPSVLAVVRVVPGVASVPEAVAGDREVELAGMQVAMEYERAQGRSPEDVSGQNLGYDIRSSAPNGSFRYIEVKARADTGPVALTPNEWLMANRLGSDYWLYVVEQAASNPVLYRIQDPASCLCPEEEISIVRYVIRDWKEKAQRPA